jgi:hypothetical protein
LDDNTDNNLHDDKNDGTGLMVDSSFVKITKNKRNSNLSLVGDKNKELQEVVQDKGEIEVDHDQSSKTHGVEEEASFDKITENKRKSNLSSVLGNKYEEQVRGNKNEDLEERVKDQGKLEVDHDQSSDTDGVEDEASCDKITVTRTRNCKKSFKTRAKWRWRMIYHLIPKVLKTRLLST